MCSLNDFCPYGLCSDNGSTGLHGWCVSQNQIGQWRHMSQGGCISINMLWYQYRDPYHKVKMVMRSVNWNRFKSLRYRNRTYSFISSFNRWSCKHLLYTLKSYNDTNRLLTCPQLCPHKQLIEVYASHELVVTDPFKLAGLILGLHPANERRRYKVTPSLIG